MSAVAEVTQGDFEQRVLQSSEPVVVDFWAPGCGPCVALAPVVEKVARKFAGQVKFFKLNTVENAGISERYHVQVIPQLLLFNGGHVIDRIVGFVPEGRIDSMLSLQGRSLTP